MYTHTLNFGLGEDLDNLRDMVRRFAAAEMAPLVREAEERERFPKALFRRWGELGLIGARYPAGDGGSGMDKVADCIIREELSYVCQSFASSLSAHAHLGIWPIWRTGTEAQKERWLKPLLNGEIRSCFAMTEPAVASSDATNIQAEIRREGDHYVINAHKWYTTGASNPKTKICIFMGKTDPGNPDRHKQQSMILVPMDTPGITVTRSLPVFGYYGVPDRASEVLFENVKVPASNLLLGEGRGFEIAQGRLGPGRIHHCMRLIGLAERALRLMCERAVSRTAFGKTIAQQTVTQERIAEARCLIDQARLLTLKAAWMMDVAGNKSAKAEIAMIKVVAPNMACQVIDWAMQVHGGAGMSQDFPLAYFYTLARTLRFADGPDEVHRNAIAKIELGKVAPRTS